MLQRDYERELALIRSLRRQGVLTPQEAYERHMSLLAHLRGPSEATAVLAPREQRVYSLQESQASTSSPTMGWLLFGVVVAMVGGAFGIPGAFLQELYAGGGILLAFTGAPIIEEALKPIGVYILLMRWPQAIGGRLHTALLSALGGLSFAVLESLVYVTLYFPEGSSDFVLFRFTVPLVMHSTASFLVGLGLTRTVFDWAAGRAPMPRQARNFYFAAVALHALYNLTAVILAILGVLDFE
ncbi:MAG TPA: PrsW family glutamic-type intramembrane protease [Dehalococcoidia bacterium]|nr:PrsW family glutamic-type intramembrane protease [Dehalococcoidia bacterium]